MSAQNCSCLLRSEGVSVLMPFNIAENPTPVFAVMILSGNLLEILTLFLGSEQQSHIWELAKMGVRSLSKVTQSMYGNDQSYSHKLPNNRENTNCCFLGSLYKHNIHEGAVAMSCAP